ncbi:MAG: hypothetical protein IPL84_07590 [Chitinophagaceae bacterium]|nr:hypothetical protein [Chitinophagaceae bacterium]
MKKLSIYLGLLLAGTMLLSITGCYKDVIIPDAAVDPDGPPKAVAYKTELAPIFNTQCAIAGCHVSGSHKPYLPTADSYREITSGGFVNTLIPKQSILYKKINESMKEYIPKAEERQKVYDWIRNGAPNN